MAINTLEEAMETLKEIDAIIARHEKGNPKMESYHQAIDTGINAIELATMARFSATDKKTEWEDDDE